jgi:hypothetical protein
MKTNEIVASVCFMYRDRYINRLESRAYVSFVLFGKKKTTNAKKRKENKRNGKHKNKQNQQSSLERRRRRRTKWSVPHCFVEFGYFGFQIGTLVGQKSKLADVAGLVALRIVISQLGCFIFFQPKRRKK